ncbi:MAG TPA: hypothetical protein VMZ52_00470 [Bryobacteraceae bacterium]|nr:hypothetical protein [Bryobacteraceae bacterium]
MAEAESAETILIRFNRLMECLVEGCFERTCFQPWEVALLLDIESCTIQQRTQKRLLLRYRKAVNKQLENGATRPLRLSEYLSRRRARTVVTSPVLRAG